MKDTCIKEAGKQVLNGLYSAADAILLTQILNYARVTDMATLVRNVVPDEVMQKFNHDAAKQAPRVVDLGRVAYEGTLTKQIEHRI